jgi:hypothetical protein
VHMRKVDSDKKHSFSCAAASLIEIMKAQGRGKKLKRAKCVAWKKRETSKHTKSSMKMPNEHFQQLEVEYAFFVKVKAILVLIKLYRTLAMVARR